jgi:heme/copper-type cytochrome/quinol oxidase subunit 2
MDGDITVSASFKATPAAADPLWENKEMIMLMTAILLIVIVSVAAACIKAMQRKKGG